MWLTKEQRIEDDERWKSRDVRAELTYLSHHVKDRKNTTNLDLRFYMWLFRNALKMMEEYELERKRTDTETD